MDILFFLQIPDFLFIFLFVLLVKFCIFMMCQFHKFKPVGGLMVLARPMGFGISSRNFFKTIREMVGTSIVLALVHRMFSKWLEKWLWMQVGTSIVWDSVHWIFRSPFDGDLMILPWTIRRTFWKRLVIFFFIFLFFLKGHLVLQGAPLGWALLGCAPLGWAPFCLLPFEVTRVYQGLLRVTKGYQGLT